MPTITLPDGTFHYETAGSGDPLLMLHGGLGTALLHFRREIPVFAEHYRVIAPDMRGYGQSSPPREYPLDFYSQDAADMAALLERLDVHPAHVIGWSDGAIVALVLAVARPDLVRSLVLSAGEALLLEEERANWPPLTDTSTWSPRAVDRFIQAHGPLNWPGILDRMLAGYTAVLDAGGEIVATRLGEIRCPVLILHGDQDDVVPVKHAHTLRAGIPHAEMHLFPGAGHVLHRERETEFRSLVLDFLARRS
jgi:pimeloyl-ACP methyl ester carboxylesterase